MSFFWSTSYTPQPSTPPTPVVKKVESPVVVEEQPTPVTPIPVVAPAPVPAPRPAPVLESNRSVPTADAFRQPQVTRVPRKKVDVDLTVDVESIVKTKTVSIADAETPLNSGYNSPRYDVQFMDDGERERERERDVFVYSEPCTPVCRRRESAVFPLVETKPSGVDEIVHRLEHLFERGLYHHSNVVHQGVYNGRVLHGGYTSVPSVPSVPSPDRDDLDVNSNFNLYNFNRDASREERGVELHRNYLDLIAQNHQILKRLEALTNQLGSELCIF